MQAFLHAAATNPSPDFAAGFVMGMVSNDYQEEIKTCYTVPKHDLASKELN